MSTLMKEYAMFVRQLPLNRQQGWYQALVMKLQIASVFLLSYLRTVWNEGVAIVRSQWQRTHSLPMLLKSRNFTPIELHEWLVTATLTNTWELEPERRFRRFGFIPIFSISFLLLLIPIGRIPWFVTVGLVLVLTICVWLFTRDFRYRFGHCVILVVLAVSVGALYLNLWSIFIDATQVMQASWVRGVRFIVVCLLVYAGGCLWASRLSTEVMKFLAGSVLWIGSGSQYRRVAIINKITAWLFVMAPYRVQHTIQNGIDRRGVQELDQLAQVSHPRVDWVSSTLTIFGIGATLFIASEAPAVVSLLDTLITPIDTYITESWNETIEQVDGHVMLGDFYVLSFSIYLLILLSLVFILFQFLTDSYLTMIAHRLVQQAYRQAQLLYDQGYDPTTALQLLEYHYDSVDTPNAPLPKGMYLVGRFPELTQSSHRWRRLFRHVDTPYEITHPW